MPGELSSIWWGLVLLGLCGGVVSGTLGLGSGLIFVPALVLLFAVPQKSAQGTAPLEKAAERFEEETGIHVAIYVCARHCARPEAEEATGTTGGDDFLLEIADAGIHDLAIGGAEYLLDDGEVRGIVQAGRRRTIACRRSAIVVPKGNPKDIRSLEDLAKPGVRVGISMIDCLKGLWEGVAGRPGLLEPIRRNITFRANGCVAIVEAVAQRVVDAAFGWSAFGHLDADRLEVVELPESQQVWRGTGVGMLSFAKSPELAQRFMDFLTTPEARAFYEEFGWVAPKD
ncbi:MAG TPA: substrate-binding domain-containing protein [Phycisphaerae bacterium]|nr:substrate-binding domain-containing protein [Phycisphaerae bacterium]